MLLSLIPPRWLSLHGLLTVTCVLVYVVTTHVLQQRRHPSAAIGWVLFMLLLPYAALPLYLLFGTRKLERNDRSRAHAAVISPGADACAWPAEVAAALGQPHPANYRALCIHADGAESLRALLEMIDAAVHTLDVCTFLLGRDAVGAAVIAHLAAKARAGVRVRLLLDGVGRMMGGWPDLSPLVHAGGRVGLFAPLLRFNLRGRTNLRNHRKYAVADAGGAAERLWCGGRNLADIARHRSLRALAAAGARVWLAPQMLHAKAAIIDDALALTGSANLDSRSLFLNYELMAAFHDAGDIARFSAWIERERRAARRYDAQPPGLWRDFVEGLVLWIGFQL